jgi:flavin-dependent dehydrogenase
MNTQLFKSDVVVIGSGPGGSATAISCALKGLQVILIEAKLFPRLHPGETLHPGVEPLLKQLGVFQSVLEAGFLRHAGNWVQWEGEKKFIPFGEDASGTWFGFQAWRPEFDRILLSRAIALGVKVLHPCSASKLLLEKNTNRIIGVETSQGIIQAAKVIDAAGSNHWLAKKIDIPINYHSPRLIARYGYAIGECPPRDNSPAIVADSQGWTWTAKVRPHLYQWTRLSLTKEKIEKDWLPKEYEGLQIKYHSQAADVTWRIVSQPAGDGYYMVGDAAMVLDPSSSHGVLKALMSGMLAGHLLASEYYGKINEFEANYQYSQWINNWFQNDVQELKKMYAMLPIKLSC